MSVMWAYLAVLIAWLVAWRLVSRDDDEVVDEPERCPVCDAQLEADWIDDDWHCPVCGFAL